MSRSARREGTLCLRERGNGVMAGYYKEKLVDIFIREFE
jgi:hypothetical protein